MSERLQAWVDDVQLSNRLGIPHYANPGELKDDIRAVLADLAATQQALEKAEGYAAALVTYTEHRRTCASQKWYPNLSRPECDCDLDSLRKDLDDSLAASVVEGEPDA